MFDSLGDDDPPQGEQIQLLLPSTFPRSRDSSAGVQFRSDYLLEDTRAVHGELGDNF